MKLFNLTRQELVVEHLAVADKFGSRFWGLMGKKELKKDAGLLLKPCSAVHTWFMKFPLDLIFLDREYRVVKMVEKLPPFWGADGGPKAQIVLELPGGKIAEKRVFLGDQLALVTKI